ncbi:hypothetical protein [Candidatus Nitrospira salsa]
MPLRRPSDGDHLPINTHRIAPPLHAQSEGHLPKLLIKKLLKLYDYPHPLNPQIIIPGYDKSHALRTASLCRMVAKDLGYPADRIRLFEITCLLHDLGRAGLDQPLFGKIWSWAKTHGIPTRPREWRTMYPHTPYGKETEAFLLRYGKDLERQNIPLDEWTTAQVEMRLGFARRLRKHLRGVKPHLRDMGISWVPWMEQIMLYYYYPEKLRHAPRWVRQLAEILVACEQLEAYNNRQRGRDYYTRSRESLKQAFHYLQQLQSEGIVSEPVLLAIQQLMTRQSFIKVLTDARGKPFTQQDFRYIQNLQKDFIPCQS